MNDDYTDFRDHQDPINNPIGAGLDVGFRRPRFRHDAPRWVTAAVFLTFVVVFLAAIVLSIVKL